MEIAKGQKGEVWRLPRANGRRCGFCQGPMGGGVEVAKGQGGGVEIAKGHRRRCGGCQGPMGGGVEVAKGQ